MIEMTRCMGWLAQAVDETAPLIPGAAPTTNGSVAAPTSQPTGFFQGLLSSWMFPLILMMVVMMFISSRSRKKEEAQRRALLDNVKRGDRIQTSGGIIGTVVETRDKEVVVKVDESANVKMHFARSAIVQVLSEDKPSA